MDKFSPSRLTQNDSCIEISLQEWSYEPLTECAPAILILARHQFFFGWSAATCHLYRACKDTAVFTPGLDNASRLFSAAIRAWVFSSWDSLYLAIAMKTWTIVAWKKKQTNWANLKSSLNFFPPVINQMCIIASYCFPSLHLHQCNSASFTYHGFLWRGFTHCRFQPRRLASKPNKY